MSKKSLRVISVLVVLAFLCISAPALNSAEKKAPKLDVKGLVMKPLLYLASLLNFLPPITDEPANTSTVSNDTKAGNNNGGIVKPTGDAVIMPPVKKD